MVALVLLPVLVSILSLAAMVHTDLGARAAAAAGARSAASAGGFGPAQLDRVRRELRSGGIDPGSCAVSATAATVGLDEPVAVTVRCPQHVGVPFLLERDVEVGTTAVGRGEVNR
ncbi:MAG TPA: hypothetical protein VGL20_16330 [Candidatus Dormibacteraeota bacterium]